MSERSERTPTTTRRQVVGEADVAAGILAAAGALHVDLTVDDITARLAAVRSSISLWRAGGSSAGSHAAGFARWTRPRSAVLATGLRRDLATAFVRTFPPTPSSSATFLRLEVGGLEESRVLSGATAGGVHVVPHLRIGAWRTQPVWRSPLRVGIAGESGADVVVVEPGEDRALAVVVAPVAVVVGAPAADVVELLNRMVALGYRAIALVDDPQPDLVERLGAALARGLPLDVALASSTTGDVVLVVDDAMLRTEPPVAAAPSAAPSAAPPTPSAAPSAPFRPRRFRWRWRTNEATPDESESVRDRGLTLDSDGVEPELAGVEPEPAGVEPAPDRRLQAEVRDDTGNERRDGFAAGRRHELRIRIAAERSDTVISADRAFTSPVVGKAVDLTIVVRTRGSAERPVRRTLRLPADGDTEWTNPIPIDVPAQAAGIAVELVVFHAGRTLQTAVLTGPVLAGDGHAGTGRLELRVDADVPNAAARSRAPAPATLMLGGTAGAPEVVDLSELGRVIPPDRLASATKAVRGVLLDAFVNERPQNLAEAAGVLTKLAVRGATLHGALRGNADSFHDDDPWIHVVSFGASDVPLELVYTHPMPDRDDEVPVCDEALGGATECVRTCGGRTRSDRVCPFGFWGTSKVVERRLHVGGRVGVDAPAARRVSLTDAAVVGMSNKTDADDTGASGRIVKAVEGAVARGACRRVMKWDELRAAVGAGTPGVIVLVTHTSKALDPDDDLGISLELGGDEQPVHRIDKSFVNPGPREPGPIVISLGCDTRHLDVGFSDWVGVLHAARAELVVSTISPVPGKDVADLVERLFSLVPRLLRGPGPYRFGELLTVVRRALIAEGDVLALAITASGDGDVELSGELGQDPVLEAVRG